MVIVIGSQKGGVGKSTIAVNIAAELVRLGKDVMVVDSDSQATASRWWASRNLYNKQAPKINSVQKHGVISDSLLDLRERYEYVLVDAPGHDSKELRSAIVVADTVLLPLKPSQLDIDTLPHISEIIINARIFNREMKALAVLSIAPTNSWTNEVDNALSVLKEYPELRLLKTIIYDRKIYRDAAVDGLGVVEMPIKSGSEINAQKEVVNLVEELINGE